VSAAARRRWGFHQLSDHWAQLLVHGAGIGPRDLVVDVGAGTGALTAALLDGGARVIAVELHPRRAHDLRLRFSHSDVVVVQVDASDLRLPRRPFKVVANPPFGIASALLRRLLGPGSRLQTADVVLPAWAARRWASPAAPGASRWRPAFGAAVKLRLPADAFRPPAPAPTAVLRLERRSARVGAPNAPPAPHVRSEVDGVDVDAAPVGAFRRLRAEQVEVEGQHRASDAQQHRVAR